MYTINRISNPSIHPIIKSIGSSSCSSNLIRSSYPLPYPSSLSQFPWNRFITKAKSTISEDQLREFEASFAHFDKDGSGYLDRIEFKAALSALSIPTKDEDTFNKLFLSISQGNDKISKEQFMNYMISISEDKDTAEQIKASFQV